ncbi:MAG: preprotein translocase subunit SecG [Verrucomicrobiota bacterium]
MFFVTGLLTVLLVLDCLFLILLVLIQLPKKEAGAGLAFGGGATDALFGAGSGNALTKITKYATIAFFVLLMLISVIQASGRSGRTKDFERAIEQQNKQGPASAPAGTPLAPPATAPVSNPPVQLELPPSATPTPAAASTNAVPK